jgi:hypothetical protein
MSKGLQNCQHSGGTFFVLLFAVFSILGQPAIAQSQVTNAGVVTIQGSSRFIIEAKNVKDKYQIDVKTVGTERMPLKAGQTLPVIYVLDGNTQFQLVSSIANVLASSRLAGFGPGIPQVLIVSIGYLEDSNLTPLENYNKMILQQRHRDYTPILDESFLKANPELPPHSGAPNFLAFIEQELKPFIGSRYPVDTDHETLVGHSMGGLFVLWTQVNRSQAFDCYVATSPGLAWGDYRPLGNEFPAGIIPPKSVYIAVGTREENDMIATASAFSQALKVAVPKMDVTFEFIPDEDHASVIPVAITRGLQSVFNQ